MRNHRQCKYKQYTSYVCASKRVRERCMWAMRQQATRPSVARRLRQKTLARRWGPRPRCARRRRALSRQATCEEPRLRKQNVPDLWWTVMSPRMLAAVLGPTKSFDPGLGSAIQTGVCSPSWTLMPCAGSCLMLTDVFMGALARCTAGSP